MSPAAGFIIAGLCALLVLLGIGCAKLLRALSKANPYATKQDD